LFKKKIDALKKQVQKLNIELKKAKVDTMRDGLTGLYNRQAFDRYMQNIIERNMVSKAPFSMMIIEIDNYDKILETYGPQIGDRTVLAIAQEFDRITINDAFFSRFEGPSFSVVLPGESLKQTSKIARKFCEDVSAIRYSVSDVQEGHDFSFTVSIGVSKHRKDDTVFSVTGRAEKALLAAKNSGKNRVVSEKVQFMLFSRGDHEIIEPL